MSQLWSGAHAGVSVILNADAECGGITVAGRLELERANSTLLPISLPIQPITRPRFCRVGVLLDDP